MLCLGNRPVFGVGTIRRPQETARHLRPTIVGLGGACGVEACRRPQALPTTGALLRTVVYVFDIAETDAPECEFCFYEALILETVSQYHLFFQSDHTANLERYSCGVHR